MRRVLAVALLVAVGAASGSALGAAGPRSPLVYALRPSDFPAKADPADFGAMPPSFARKLRGIGVTGRGAQYFASIPFGPERSQTVQGLVVSTASPADARTVFAWQRRTAMRPGKNGARIGLPRFGDAQLAIANGETDSGRLLVRRGRVVWRLEVAADGEAVLSPARVRDELEKYAAKQKQRVGAG